MWVEKERSRYRPFRSDPVWLGDSSDEEDKEPAESGNLLQAENSTGRRVGVDQECTDRRSRVEASIRTRTSEPGEGETLPRRSKRLQEKGPWEESCIENLEIAIASGNQKSNEISFIFRYLLLLLGVCFMLGQMGETRRATSSQESTAVPGLNSGLLFTPKGTLILATGEWTVVTRLKSHGLRHQATKIQGYFSLIDRAVTGLPEFEADKPEGRGRGTERNEITNGTRDFREQEVQRRRKIKQNVIKMWQRERMWMEHELFITEREMKELQTKLKLSRKTRGLLPFMGGRTQMGIWNGDRE